MRMLPLIIFLAVLEFCILLYSGTLIVGPVSPDLNNSVTSTVSGNSAFIAAGGSSATSSSIMNYILNPDQWNSSSLIITIITLIGVGLVVTLIAGIFFKTDTMILFPLFISVLGFGSIPIISLMNLIQQQRSYVGCPIDGYCAVMTIPYFFIGLIGIMWIWTCITWWRQGQ